MPLSIIGIGASPGKAKGKALVFKNLDPEKINEEMQAGLILVIPYSSPLITFSMFQAKAIVTDMGGVTCHTAIVAREMGIPCVVGTKIATQLIANDMLLFVDGYEGLGQALKK